MSDGPPREVRFVPGVCMAAIAACLAVQAAVGWSGVADGYHGPEVPAWNTLVALLGAGVAAGVFAHEWALGWASGIALLNGISTASWALPGLSPLGLVSVAVHAVGALVFWVVSTKHPFPPDPPSRVALSRVVGGVALALSLGACYVSTKQGTGSERGRQRFAADIQAGYDEEEAPVKVLIEGLTLRILAPGDADAAIRSVAADLRRSIASDHDARAWVVGFERLEVSNGRLTEVIARPQPK